MNRTTLFAGLLCIIAQGAASQDFWDQESIDAYEATSCSNPANADKWGIRRPTPDEVAEHGTPILIFQYLNSKTKCSNATELGIWFEGHRMLMLQVETLGKEYDGKERITVTPVKGSIIVIEKPGSVLLEDSDEYETWILRFPIS